MSFWQRQSCAAGCGTTTANAKGICTNCLRAGRTAPKPKHRTTYKAAKKPTDRRIPATPVYEMDMEYYRKLQDERFLAYKEPPVELRPLKLTPRRKGEKRCD